MSLAPDRDPGAKRRPPLVAWDGPLFCHAPADAPFDPCALGAGGDHADRWCRPGEPTAYLASDPGVALAELARHHPPDGERAQRRIVRLDPGRVPLRGLVDLRDAAIRRAVGAPDPPSGFLDIERARAVADRIRSDERHQGLIVPSMAFLDDPSRCNVVLFADRVGDLGERLQASSEVARLVLADA